MEVFLTCFARSFLHCVLGEEPTPRQVKVLLTVARRADFEHLVQGDIVIPLKSPLLREVTVPNTLFGRLLLDPTDENIKGVQEALVCAQVPVAKVWLRNHVLRLHLNKLEIMKTIFPVVAKEELCYGASKHLEKVSVTIAHDEGKSDLHKLRGHKLVNHMKMMLEFCGARVTVKESEGSPSKHDEECVPVVQGQRAEERTDRLFTSQVNSFAPSLQEDNTDIQDSPYRESKGELAVSTNPHKDRKSNSSLGENKYLGDKAQGRGEKSGLLSALEEMDLENYTDKKESDNSSEWTENSSDLHKQSCQKTCVLMCGNRNSEGEGCQTALSEHKHNRHSLNQLEIRLTPAASDMLTAGTENREKAPPLVCYCNTVVDVKTGKVWPGCVQDYIKMLIEELKRTTEVRLGEVSGPEWEAFLEEQAHRCLTLQLLSVSHSNQVKVELEGCTHNTKEWAFMLYNYSRLCTIFESFDERVAEGEFAPLPPAGDMDFSLLRHDEEWVLVWVYLLRWPEIVEEMASSLLNQSGKMKTAYVTRFLHSLSHRLSEYYSRHQVLAKGSFPHLLPLMYARLHLLQAISTLMRVCFTLLGVKSLPSVM